MSARPRILLPFATSWDLRELPRLGERWDVVPVGPLDVECPWDLDVPGLVDALAAEQAGRADGVFSASDYPGAIVAAALAERLGLRGPRTVAVLLASHKHEARRVLARALPDATPRFELVDPDAPRVRDVGFPCFLKPVKGAFSVATRLVRDEDELRAFLGSRAVLDFRRDYARMFDALVARFADPAWASGAWFLAEEPMSGAQVTVEGWTVGERHGVLGVVDSIRDPATGSFLRFDHPTALGASARARCEDVAVRAARALGLDRTLWNVELFVGDDGRPHVIEVNPRMVAQFSDLYEKVDGVSGYEAALAVALGDEPPPPRAGSCAAASSVPLRVFEPCRVVRAPSSDDVRAAEALFPGTRVTVDCTTGQELADFATLEDGASFRYGVVNLGGASREEIDARFEAIVSRLGFVLAS